VEFDYSLLFLWLSVLFIILLIFNSWYFRRLVEDQNRRKKEIDQLHLENIEQWKDYAVTCKKFKQGECDLSIPCDICTYYEEPKDEQKG
jgi:hypothetical protein